MLAHHFHGFSGYFDQPEKVDFHLCAVLLFGQLLEDSGETIACVVDDDVHALEFVNCRFECCIDVGFLCDVELEREVVLDTLGQDLEEVGWMSYLIGCILEGERFWLSRCGNGDVSPINDFLDEVVPETSRGSCNKENARHDC